MNEWEIERTDKSMTDHAGVTVKVLEPEAPYMGHGEWRMNLAVLEHAHFVAKSTEAIETLKERDKRRNESTA